MTTHPTDTAVALRHAASATAALPPAQPKPTSLTGQVETAASLWSDAGTDAGIWECEPGEFTADRSGGTEVCHVISGAATVVGDDGTQADVGPGSLLVLPKGWRGRWVVTETIRKTYVIVGA